MEKFKRQYSFEDWKADKIPTPDPKDIPDHGNFAIWKAVTGGKDWPFFWLLAGMIDGPTRKQIESAQEHSYIEGARYVAEARFKAYVQRFNALAAPEIKKSDLQMEIKKREQQWTIDLKQSTNAGKTNREIVTPAIYHSLLTPGQLRPTYRIDTENGWCFDELQDPLFYCHACQQYIDKLKDLQMRHFITDQQVYLKMMNSPLRAPEKKKAFVLYVEKKYNLKNHTEAYYKAKNIAEEISGTEFYKSQKAYYETTREHNNPINEARVWDLVNEFLLNKPRIPG